jgi:tetratricopeptide (TPR) repeat protein
MDDKTLGLYLTTLGLLRYQEKKFHRALRYYRSAKTALPANHHLHGVVAKDLGLIFLETGDYASARTAFMRAFSLSKKAGSAKQITQVLLHLALVDFYNGNILNAKTLLEEAFDRTSRANKVADADNCSHNLALIDLLMGKANEAIKRCESGLAISSHLDRFQFLGMTFQHLGVCHLDQGRFTEAKAHFIQAEAAYADEEDGTTPAELFSYWALLEAAQGNLIAGEEKAERAVAIARESSLPEFLSRSLFTLGVLQICNGKSDGIDLVREGITIGRRVRVVLLEMLHDGCRWCGGAWVRSDFHKDLSWAERRYRLIMNVDRERRVQGAIASTRSPLIGH